MTGAGEGMLSLLLDVIPVITMLGLGFSFLRKRSACRKEEARLREEIRLFQEGKEEAIENE